MSDETGGSEARPTGDSQGRPAGNTQPTPVDAPPTQADTPPTHADDLLTLLSSKVVGQPTALEYIVPSIQRYRSGLAPEGRPVGVFLLLGPTGTGKTRTVEALAEVLHGSPHKVLKVDCGEFQSEHEVAKLIGAPPGYVGHSETRPRLTQQELKLVTSEECDLALVLFDEIEKAAPSLAQLLLGILDRAILRLGDGSMANFEDCLIFLTSNLGARRMMEELKPTLGFDTRRRRSHTEVMGRLEQVGLAAVRKHFSPEFVNRIDSVVTYRPLAADSLVAILDHHILELQRHVHSRLGIRSFEIEVAPAARYFILDHGTSVEYGAREIRRVIHRHLTQPLAAEVANGQIPPGSNVTVDLGDDGKSLTLRVQEGSRPPTRLGTVLVVDDNDALLIWAERVLGAEGCEVITASSCEEARELTADRIPDAAILDHILPDGDGASLGVELQRRHPYTQVIVMSGMSLPEEAQIVCERYEFPILTKPFVADELLALLRAGALSASAAG